MKRRLMEHHIYKDRLNGHILRCGSLAQLIVEGTAEENIVDTD